MKYPRWMHHKTLESKIIRSAEEDAAARKSGYVDSLNELNQELVQGEPKTDVVPEADLKTPEAKAPETIEIKPQEKTENDDSETTDLENLDGSFDDSDNTELEKLSFKQLAKIAIKEGIAKNQIKGKTKAQLIAMIEGK